MEKRIKAMSLKNNSNSTSTSSSSSLSTSYFNSFGGWNWDPSVITENNNNNNSSGFFLAPSRFDSNLIPSLNITVPARTLINSTEGVKNSLTVVKS